MQGVEIAGAFMQAGLSLWIFPRNSPYGETASFFDKFTLTLDAAYRISISA
jgi:hypothetical protein